MIKKNLIIRKYSPSDEKWLQYRLISFPNSEYYDDDFTLHERNLW